MKEDRPDIVAVIERYGIELKRRGRELWALCPFHSEKTASLAVNPDKQLFHCHGCHVGGDVIRFVELIEKISFKEACARLQLGTIRPKPQPKLIEAKQITTWARVSSKAICAALRDIGDEISVCKLARQQDGTDRALIAHHETKLIRQWGILTDLDDDLNDPKIAIELWNQRPDIDRLVESLA